MFSSLAMQRFSLASRASKCVFTNNNSFMVSPLSFASRSYAKKDLEEKRKEKKAKEAVKKQKDEQAKEKDASKKAKTTVKTAVKPKPKIPRIKAKPTISTSADAKTDVEVAAKISSFLASHQTIDFAASRGLLGYEAKIASVEAFDSFVKETLANFESILSDEVEKNLKTMSADQLVAALDKLELIRIRVVSLGKALSESHRAVEAKAAAAASVERFLSGITKRYLENPQIAARVGELLNSGSLSPINQRYLQVIHNRHQSNGSTVEDLDRRNALQEQIQDYKQKKSVLLSYFDGIAAIDFKQPSRLYEIPSEVYASIEKKTVKKKGRFAVLNLHKDLLPILENVSVPRTRQSIVEPLIQQVDNDKSMLYTRLDPVLQSGSQIAKAFKAESLVDVNLMGLGVTKQQIIDLFSDVRDKMDSAIKNQLKDMLAMKKKQLSENPKQYAYKPPQGEGQESETDKLTTADVLYYSNKYYAALQSSNAADAQKFFPVSRVILGVSNLMQTLFGLKLVPAQVSPSETWDPKFIKKMDLVEASSNTVVASVYLDLFARDSKQGNKSHTVQNSTSPAIFVSCNLGENILGYEATVSHGNLKAILRQLGEGLSFVFAQKGSPLLLAAENPLLKQVSGFVFERFAYDRAFVKSFAISADNKQCPDQYISDYIVAPSIYPVLVLDKIVHSLIDFELNGPQPLKDKPAKLIAAVEARILPHRFIPDFSQWKQFGGLVFMETFARIAAAHISATLFANGATTAGGAKLKETLSVGYVPIAQALQTAVGTQKVDASHFVKQVTANLK